LIIPLHRRDWLKRVTVGGVAVLAARWDLAAARAAEVDDSFPQLADAALGRAESLGASFADFRIMQTESESLFVRERMVQDVSAATSLGGSVRVVVDGAWGFAAAEDLSAEGVARLAAEAVAIARAQAGWRKRRVEIESLPRHIGRFDQPAAVDPFAVPLESKIAALLGVTAAAEGAGANFCHAALQQVRERTWLANTFGSRIVQSRIRLQPGFGVTVIDEKTGRFADREGSVPPRAAGWEHVTALALQADAARAVEEAREKLVAPSVESGRKDLVIAPSNLWLTIHETVGHPTELDRALGDEANFAGTSFCTPDRLDRLRFASDIVSFRGERTEPGGVATTAFDDDGVPTAGREFFIVEQGVFRNYQMALGQAGRIGRQASNACGYAESFDAFPLQRMPNISLEPGRDAAVTAETLVASIDDGIFIEGNGSWSIDQQRYNFQFTGQVFHRIKNGRLAGMLRDVAYQGNSVDFWNACDGLGGGPSRELYGALHCGKGQPQQAAPVSHGAVPARFRGINVLNTAEQAAGKKTASHGGCGAGAVRRWA
jgi:TldD protein